MGLGTAGGVMCRRDLRSRLVERLRCGVDSYAHANLWHLQDQGASDMLAGRIEATVME